MTAELAIKTLQRKGFQFFIKEKEELTKLEIANRWSKSIDFVKKILKDVDCKLEVSNRGSRGRGNSTTYYTWSVEEEQKRLVKNKRI